MQNNLSETRMKSPTTGVPNTGEVFYVYVSGGRNNSLLAMFRVTGLISPAYDLIATQQLLCI